METAAAGGHTISMDEMTGIQALEHKSPDKPVVPGKPAYVEFEYIRHGTTSLIGFFDVASGRLESPYLNATRTEEDLVKAVRALVETDPEAQDPFHLYTKTLFMAEPDRNMVWNYKPAAVKKKKLYINRRIEKKYITVH